MIRDKRGRDTAKALLHEQGWKDLQQIIDTVGVPLKFIHIVRNPFDTIATSLLRKLKKRENATKVNEIIVRLWFKT